MKGDKGKVMRNITVSRIFRLVFPLICVFILFGCGQRISSTNVLFTDPLQKIEELSNSNFSAQLFIEAVTMDPQFYNKNTKVHMGFWSGTWPVFNTWNRTNLITVIDAINSCTSSEVLRAIWDEGITTAVTKQYPSYITMNREYWYERANFVNGWGSIEGVWYRDPHPVTFAQADQIWGSYSQRYIDVASLERIATGKTPEAWCFVTGGKANRIFYVFELPELRSLEAKGNIIVHFATTPEAHFDHPSEWVTGTENAPAPLPASSVPSFSGKAYN